MVVPAYSVVLSSLVSIQATPVTRLVLTALGRRYAAYIVGTPSTERPIGCHWPSPGVDEASKGVMAAGAARWTGPAGAVVVVLRSGAGMAPLAGFPPLGGACSVYQVFSAQVTRPPPPCPRTHSVSRTPTVVPLAGFMAAEPADTHTGVSNKTTTR